MTLPHISQPGQAASAPLLLYLHGAGEVGGDTVQPSSCARAAPGLEPCMTQRMLTDQTRMLRFATSTFWPSICRREIGTVRRWMPSLWPILRRILPPIEGDCS
jgi:hypothetical protein